MEPRSGRWDNLEQSSEVQAVRGSSCWQMGSAQPNKAQNCFSRDSPQTGSGPMRVAGSEPRGGPHKAESYPRNDGRFVHYGCVFPGERRGRYHRNASCGTEDNHGSYFQNPGTHLAFPDADLRVHSSLPVVLDVWEG